ncbi:MAG: ABC transporter ATP-binding protein [Anaerolineae bacterium]
MSFLLLENLVKEFVGRGGEGIIRAVDRATISIQEGEFVTLLGPSGCGKTTTLRLIAGFEFPTEGRIILDGEAINEQPPNRRNMAMVFQSYAIFPHLNVFENIAYGLKIQRLSARDIQDKVRRVLELTELTGLENRAPNALSGGQQQRVALARALIMEPKVLLMDEPLSNLDAKLREVMRTEIRRIQQTLGITSVYVTHDQIEAMTLSDRVVVMNNGRIEQIGAPTDIYRRPQTAFVADFIGRTNFVDGTVRQIDDKLVTVEVLGQPLVIAKPQSPTAQGQTVKMVVRPEAVQIVETGGQYQGTVRWASYMGSVVEYEIEVAGQRLIVVDHDPRHTVIHPLGQQVGIKMLDDCLYILPDTSA